MAATWTRLRQIFAIICVILIIPLIVQQNRDSRRLEYVTKSPNVNLPIIFAITPTYKRPEQKAELTRISHMFLIVPNLFWIIVEDSKTKTPLVHNLLERTNLTHRSVHMAAETPGKIPGKQLTERGIEQRNKGLEWIRANADPNEHSIVYFMDDANSYSIELFSEIAKTEKGRVSVWPVGLVDGLKVEMPVLYKNKTKVAGFNALYRPDRQFPIDMAGFAISTDLLLEHPKAKFAHVKAGHVESEILRQVTTREKLQPLADGCTQILVWHLRTSKTPLEMERKLNKKGRRTNEGLEV